MPVTWNTLETDFVLDTITMNGVATMLESAALERTRIAGIACRNLVSVMRLTLPYVQVCKQACISCFLFTYLLSGTCQYGGDGECDGGNNDQTCNFDDGDCCLEPTDCFNCEGDECICHLTGLDHCAGIHVYK